VEELVCPLEWCNACIQNPMAGEGEMSIGVDVARSVAGDENVIAVARGGEIVDIFAFHSPDTMKTAGRVAERIDRFKVSGARVNIDVTGVGGGVVDRLREQGHRVNGVAFGGKALNQRKFANRGTEMWWHVRKMAEATFDAARIGEYNAGALKLPKDPTMIGQLATRRYSVESDGKIYIESKDEMRARGEHSPDRAEAVILAVGGLGRSVWNVSQDAVTDPAELVQIDREKKIQTVKELLKQAQIQADAIRGEQK